MDTTEIVVMAVFGTLVVAGLIAGIRQSKARRERVRSFAFARGCTVSTADDHLNALLAEAFPEETWSTSYVVPVQPPPEPAYLFGYSSSVRGRRSVSQGFACLAERTRPGPDGPWTIFTRTPGLDALVGGRVPAGGEEFRGEFTVLAGAAEVARAAITSDVEHVLLQHAASPGWNLTVTVAGRSIVAASSWAQKEDEWEHLIDLVTKLRRAMT